MLNIFKERDRAFAKAKRTGLQTDINHARMLRRKATSLLRKACQTFIQEQMRIANGDSKIFWKVINENFLYKGTTVLTDIYRCDTVELVTKDTELMKSTSFLVELVPNWTNNFLMLNYLRAFSQVLTLIGSAGYLRKKSLKKYQK